VRNGERASSPSWTAYRRLDGSQRQQLQRNEEKDTHTHAPGSLSRSAAKVTGEKSNQIASHPSPISQSITNQQSKPRKKSDLLAGEEEKKQRRIRYLDSLLCRPLV